MNRVFIGVDLRQPLAYNVLQHSIHVTASKPVAVTPLYKHQLPIKRFGLTDFTFSRYLVPWLCDFKGTALFMDGDMLVNEDINGLFDWYAKAYPGENKPAVAVQVELPAFEWASMMMFDCAQCKHLTPEFVNDPTNEPQDLRQWVKAIGALPPEWNVMVNASDPDMPIPEDAKVLHFTEGLPCFFETAHTPGARQWQAAAKEATYTVPWKELMGRSVHAKPVLQQMIRRYAE